MDANSPDTGRELQGDPLSASSSSEDARSSNGRRGLPGLCGTDHIGFTVPDLEAATRFFVDIIGCEVFYDLGPFSANDDWMQVRLNVHKDAVMRRLRFFRCRNGSNFEVFEYESPDQCRRQPRNSDVGGHHLAFYVDDMGSAVAYLKRNNIKVLGDPTIRDSGPSGGQAWVYFLAPWGMQFELVSYPSGKAYEAYRDSRLWHPKYPER